MGANNLGFGLSKFGLSIFGFGDTIHGNTTTAKLFLKPDGAKGNAIKIDPSTGDFVFDANGNPVGDNSVNQMVYLALKTTYNSSALLNFGIDISNIKTITSNLDLKFKLAVNAAVKHLTDRNLITIISVDVSTIPNKPTAVQVNVKWRDQTSGEINSIKLI